MKNSQSSWSKTELMVYILLLCANADSKESKEEIDIIKTKTDGQTFDRIYTEFEGDDEDTSINKIEASVAKLKYSNMELGELRKEVNHVFQADKNFSRKERYLDRLLDNIIYWSTASDAINKTSHGTDLLTPNKKWKTNRFDNIL